MADQKRWFKVWTSIVSDDDFDPSRADGLGAVGRFCLLGAYTALHGTRGKVHIMPDTLFRLMQVQNIDEIQAISTFKNVQFEEGKNRHGKITVTWLKWKKYQEDSTQAERQKASRAKRRREEKRGEEIRQEEKMTPPTSPPVGDPDFGTFWTHYPSKSGKVAAEEMWERMRKGQGRHKGKAVPTMAMILGAIEAQQRSRRWREGIIPNPATWIHQRRWEDESAELPGLSAKGQATADAAERFLARVEGHEP